MRPYFLLCLLLISSAAFAQNLPADLVHAGYNWDTKRTQRLPIPAADAELPAVVLKDFTSLEYYFDEKAKGLRLYATEHRIVRVNSSDGIERYNKIVLPVLETGAAVDVKARTISPRGEVKEVRTADMKELKDEEGAGGFRVFAVDGVEKGSEIEYFYTRERPFNHFGSEVLQGETAARNVTFEVISPEALTFEAKVYHGPQAVADTTMPGKHVLRLTLKEVPAVRDEAFTNVRAQLMRLEYKLAFIASKGEVRQFTWADASQGIHQTMTSLSKDEAKAVDKVLAAAKVPATGPLAERIAAVERYVKLNFNLEEGASADLARIVATRNAPEPGFAHLLAALYRKLGIDFELVITCSRASKPFDASFDSWTYLDHFALYFPATKQYLAPGRPDYYYGMIPADWTGHSALFIKSVKLGKIESAVGTVKEVPTLTAEQSNQDLDIKVAFAPDLDNSTVSLRQTMGGYNAAVIQPFWTMIPEAKRTELLQQFQKGIVPDATNFKNLEVRNVERGTNPLEKPFIVDGTFESAALLDKAGPRYLFKIGTLLGPQTELYQKEERQFDVDNDTNHGYLRTIRFEVPAGYTVRNLQDLNMDVKAGPDAAKPLFDFHSGYTQQGQTVTVTISENYRQLSWPKADFEAFRAVVNAAANFNKVVLVLDKKS
jgi:hypothetical protein